MPMLCAQAILKTKNTGQVATMAKLNVTDFLAAEGGYQEPKIGSQTNGSLMSCFFHANHRMEKSSHSNQLPVV
jgi:hypothetical protein